MKKVFVFYYDGSYVDGMMLVAANNQERAIEIANEQSVGFGRWEFSHINPQLFYKGDSCVIEERSCST